MVDTFMRECLALKGDTSVPGARVARVLEQLRHQHGPPTTIVVENGPTFSGLALNAWAYQWGIQVHFITPGKPIENAYILTPALVCEHGGCGTDQ